MDVASTVVVVPGFEVEGHGDADTIVVSRQEAAAVCFTHTLTYLHKSAGKGMSPFLTAGFHL